MTQFASGFISPAAAAAASAAASSASARKAGFELIRSRTKTPSQMFDKYSFDITITPPSGLTPKMSAVGDFHPLTCTTPTKRIASDEKTLWGPVYNVPYSRVYSGDFEMSYLYNQDFHEFIMNWSDLVINNNTDKANYYDDIIGNIEIRYYSRDDTKSTTYKLNDVFPLSINGLELDMSATNSYRRGRLKFARPEARQ